MDSSVIPLHDHLTRRIAVEFFRNIRDLLSPAELTTLLQRHERYPVDVSTSPEFTLVALALTKAIETVIKRLPQLTSNRDVALLSASWNRIRALRLLEQENALLPVRQVDASVPEGDAWRFDRLQALFPSADIWHTGGGCLAVRLDCADEGYLLITDPEGAYLPEAGATEVMLGRYAANGDVVDEAVVVAVSDLKRSIEAAFDCARTPTNVSDYFVKTLGAGELDLSLRSIALAAPCGKDCASVIDSAASMVEHCRRMCGEEQHVLESHIVELARRLLRQISHADGHRAVDPAPEST